MRRILFLFWFLLTSLLGVGVSLYIVLMHFKGFERIILTGFLVSAFFLLIVFFNMTENPSVRVITVIKKDEEEKTSEKKKDLTACFIFGKDPEIDLEYFLKGFSWLIVSTFVMAIGLATAMETIPNPNSNHTRDVVIGGSLVVTGTVLGLLCAVRISFAPAFPLLKKKPLISIPLGIVLVVITLSMSISFLQVMASFQIGKIINLSKAMHDFQQIHPVKKTVSRPERGGGP